MAHLDTLKMKIRKYEPGVIYEFDTLDELREFDTSYVTDTRSAILKKVASELHVNEKDIVQIHSTKGHDAEAIGFEFDIPGSHYTYVYETENLKHISNLT